MKELAIESVSAERGADDGRLIISVLIVVEVCLYREGLARAISLYPNLRVAGSTPNLHEAAAAIEKVQPDVVLLDSATDPQFTLVARAEQVAPRSRIIALGVREAEPDVIRCAEAGVVGYVPRDASLGELVSVIESAANGEVRCSPQIAGSLFRRVALLAEGVSASDRPALTPREEQIAALIDEGLSNKQIAQRLKIGVSTVKNHVHNLLKKVNASRRGVAAARVRRSRRTLKVR